MAKADFEGEQTVFTEAGLRARDEAAVDVQAVGPGEESGVRLVFEDFALECWGVGERNVGRVRDDGVEIPLAGVECREKIAFEEADAAAEAEAESVISGDLEGCRGDVGGDDLRRGLIGGERDGDGSGAGADVEQAKGLELRLGPGEHGFDEVLGLRARDEDGGGDAEVETEELLRAGEVLQRLAGGAAEEEGLEGVALLLRERGFRVCDEPSARLVERVSEEKLRVAALDAGCCFEEDVVDSHVAFAGYDAALPYIGETLTSIATASHRGGTIKTDGSTILQRGLLAEQSG